MHDRMTTLRHGYILEDASESSNPGRLLGIIPQGSINSKKPGEVSETKTLFGNQLLADCISY